MQIVMLVLALQAVLGVPVHMRFKESQEQPG
jgi:hypothetical protein